MSNHCHMALEYRPQDALGYSDEEVARRWLVVYPPRRAGQLEARVAALLEDPERITVLRGRLGDLSWYMKCLNQESREGPTGRTTALAGSGKDGSTAPAP